MGSEVVSMEIGERKWVAFVNEVAPLTGNVIKHRHGYGETQVEAEKDALWHYNNVKRFSL
jgi:hypothetical protein